MTTKDADHRNVYLIEIDTESGCDIEKDEYGVRIVYLIRGSVGKEDYDLVAECVAEVVRDLKLPEEGQTPFIVRETGEREDVFWHKYYELEAI